MHLEGSKRHSGQSALLALLSSGLGQRQSLVRWRTRGRGREADDALVASRSARLPRSKGAKVVPSAGKAQQDRNWQALGLVVFVVASLLLLSMGGAIFAAPVTLPLMYVASRRHPTPAFRAAAVLIGALTVAEVVWAVTYLQADEAQPWIWLLPVVGGLTAALVFVRARPGRQGADPA